MKRLLTALFTVILVVGFSVGYVEAKTPSANSFIKNDISTKSVNWIFYYTDYTLEDGWYEKWYYYIDSSGTTQYKVETYNSKDILVRIRYL